MYDTEVITNKFSALRDLEQMFETAARELFVVNERSTEVCEIGAYIVGRDRLDTAVFPNLVVSAPRQSNALRGVSADTFPEMILSADPSSHTLFFKVTQRLNTSGKGPVFLAVDQDAYTNREDLWDSFTERDQKYLADWGFAPGMSADRWSRRIREVSGPPVRAVYEDRIRSSHDLPVPIQFGSIGTVASLHASPEFIARSLSMVEYPVPGDTSFGYATVHTHPVRYDFTGVEEALVRRVGEDLLSGMRSLTWVADVMRRGGEFVIRYPSLADAVLALDSQWINARILRPQIDTTRQYQEIVSIVVSMSSDGNVLGSKVFSYYDVALSGEIERFDKLITSASESGRAEKPDVGLMSEAVQEIARYTSDDMPDYLGGTEVTSQEQEQQ